METYDEILRALGRIEGQLIEIAKLSERVSAMCLSAKRKRDSAQPQDAKRKRDSAQPQDAKRKRDSAQPQEWMKGGWTALAAAYAYLCKTAFGK